jgi:hypothetical protein
VPAEAIRPVPPHRPAETPEGIRPEAFDALTEMLVSCGKTIFRMPSSCEMYLRQFLEEFSDERNLLTEALRRGVPDQIMQNARRDDYREFLATAAEKLAKEAGLTQPAAKWAVDAWAAALNRPPGYRPPPPVAEVVEAPPVKGISQLHLRLIMAGICAVGGFLGGALGNGGGLLILFVTDVAVEAEFHEKRMGMEDVAIAVVIGIVMLIGGVASGLASFGGWMFGRGNDKPWAGFGAAFGAAFGTACLAFFFLGPGFVTAGLQAVAAFGAAFTTATRGGNRV